MSKRKPSVVVSALPLEGGLLSIVEVSEKECVLSTGEVLLIRWEKLRHLAEQVCQERAAVRVRTWWTRDGVELIELRRARDGETSMSDSMDAALKTTTSEVF